MDDLKPVSSGSGLLREEDGKINIELFKEDIINKIKTGDMEELLYNIGGTIKILKEKGKTPEEVLDFIRDSLFKENKDFLICSKGEDIKKAFSDREIKKIKITSVVNPEETCLLEEAKEISGSEEGALNIQDFTIRLAEKEAVTFNNINFASTEQAGGLIKILSGLVFFNGAAFNNVRIEASGTCRIYINNSRWSGTDYPLKCENKTALSLKNTVFKEMKVPLRLFDDADLIDMEEFLKDYFSFKNWLLGSRIAAEKMIDLNNINLSETLLKVKNLKLSGRFNLDNFIEIDGEEISLEGVGDEGLTVSSDLKQAFLIKNRGVLKCRNVIFSSSSGREREETLSDGEEVKEPGFIQLENGKIKLVNCEVRNTSGGIYMAKNSEGEISSSFLGKNMTGIYLNSSILKIDKTRFEHNGNKSRPQIKVENNSEISIKESEIINTIENCGLYLCQSKGVLEKCKVKANNIGVSICDNSEVKILDSDITNNQKEGFYSHYNSNCLINRCRVCNNKSNGIVIRDHSEGLILNSSITENMRGIDIRGSKAKISKCELKSNVRGIYAGFSPLLELEKTLIEQSKLNGLFIEGTRTEICNCIIKNNCLENKEYYQIYAGKKSILNGIDTEIMGAATKRNDVYSEFESSRVLFESSRIEGGVRLGHKKSGCFITTAACLSLGKGDDCYELNKFREFRDRWLIFRKDGKKFIEDYYSIAPFIVENINKCEEKEKIYKAIWEEYLFPCLNFLEKKRFLFALNIYREMIFYLRKNYC